MRFHVYRPAVLGAGAAGALLFGCVLPPVDQPDPGEEPARFTAPTRSTNIALTSDDRRAVVVNRDANTVSVIEVRDANGADTAKKLAEVGVGDEPRYVALSPDDRFAYVANTASGTVSVVALSGDNEYKQVDTITVGTEPRALALSPSGMLLYVANHTEKTVSIIDTESLEQAAVISVGGFPGAIAITNDGDADDDDERVFVTRFFAELIPGGPGEAFDDGKQGVVVTFPVGDLQPTPQQITLSPLPDAGFTADRANFCLDTNPNAANDTFCPDIDVDDAADPAIANDPQGAFPNQLQAALIRGNRLYLPNTGAGPEPPLQFNVNVQALVHSVDTGSLLERFNEHINLNNQIKTETQPDEAIANTVLDRLFAADTLSVDADVDGDNFYFVSRGGNYVLKAQLDNQGQFDINAPDNVVRFQTGNIPSGIVVSQDGRRAYTNNEVGYSITALNLESDTVITRDIASSEPPAPGTFEHAALVGKLAFFTSLGTPDNGVFGQEIRSIVPLADRGKASDNGWSSCTSCHADGLADGVTWIFATGPRQTIPLDGFFAKNNPSDQRISNWNGVRGSITDFNNNSRNVQGGIGFAGDPPNPNIFNHGITQGASDALDAQTLWVQTVRAPIMPQDAGAALDRGQDVFATNCASCHGGAKWTKSQVLYADNPAFDANPLGEVPGAPRDPGVTNAGPQIVSYTIGALTLQYLEDVGTFDPANPIEVRANGIGALGGLGFNVPSLLGVGYHAPYFHDGSAQTLDDVLALHELAGGAIDDVLSASEQNDLIEFLQSIDGSTATLRSDADDFRDAIAQ